MAAAKPQRSERPIIRLSRRPPGKGFWTSDSFVHREIPGKGVAVIAAKAIDPGDLLVAEEPLFVVPWWVRHAIYPRKELNEAVAEALKSLKDEQAQEFYSLCDSKVQEGEGRTELGIWRTNNFALGRSHARCDNGIFPKLSRFNHSCVPNSEFRWNPKLRRMEVRAVKAIRPGEEIVLCYFTTNLLESDAVDRREYLIGHYGFVCDCRDCSLQGEQLAVNNNRRMEVRTLGKQIDDLLYEWVSEEEDETEEELAANVAVATDQNDHMLVLQMARRRLSLMDQLGFKVVSRLNACTKVVETAQEMDGHEDVALEYIKRCREYARVLCGAGSLEVHKWDLKMQSHH